MFGTKIKRPPDTPETRGLEPNGLEYEPSGGQPTISSPFGVFVGVVVFFGQIKRPPDTPERRGLEPNGLKYEPSGGKPTISCRSGVFVEVVVFLSKKPPLIKYDFSVPQMAGGSGQS